MSGMAIVTDRSNFTHSYSFGVIDQAKVEPATQITLMTSLKSRNDVEKLISTLSKLKLCLV